MQIVELTDDLKLAYFHCLEDWSSEIKEGISHKEKWYNRMKDKGLGVRIALNEEKQPVGMIHYIPIEFSFAEGKDLYFILCIWVHGYKNKGVGNYQKRGIGRALLKAAEEDVNRRGKKGMVAWGIPLPVFMRASWFKNQGYIPVDKQGFLGPVLLWKPFSEEALPPQWIKTPKEPELIDGKVTVNAYLSGWCPAYNMTFERAKKVAAEFGEAVVFKQINAFESEDQNHWKIADDLYINDKKVTIGPPPSYEKLQRKIKKEARKLGR